MRLNASFTVAAAIVALLTLAGAGLVVALWPSSGERTDEVTATVTPPPIAFHTLPSATRALQAWAAEWRSSSIEDLRGACALNSHIGMTHHRILDPAVSDLCTLIRDDLHQHTKREWADLIHERLGRDRTVGDLMDVFQMLREYLDSHPGEVSPDGSDLP